MRQRDVQLTIRIASQLRDQLDAVARLTGQTVTDLARDILVGAMVELVSGSKDEKSPQT
jgi:predicted DNA-binding protein